MPGCPLRRTCARPHEGAYTATAPEAAYRPAWSRVSFVCDVPGQLPGHHREQARSHRYSIHLQDFGRLADRLREQACSHRYSVHLQDFGRLAGRHREQARSHRYSVHLQDFGRLAGRFREQARSYSFELSTVRKTRPAGRPPRLLLICPPLRKAEWRCSSGDGRAAPFDAVELIACRSKRSRPEGNAPG